MHHVRHEGLPFKGSSHQFVGVDHSNVHVSLHVHLSPAFIRENLE